MSASSAGSTFGLVGGDRRQRPGELGRCRPGPASRPTRSSRITRSNGRSCPSRNWPLSSSTVAWFGATAALARGSIGWSPGRAATAGTEPLPPGPPAGRAARGAARRRRASRGAASTRRCARTPGAATRRARTVGPDVHRRPADAAQRLDQALRPARPDRCAAAPSTATRTIPGRCGQIVGELAGQPRPGSTGSVAACSGGELRLDLVDARVGQRAAVGEHHGRHGPVAAVGRDHDVGGRLVDLDVDLGVLDALAVEAGLEAAAVPTPAGRVHRHHRGTCSLIVGVGRPAGLTVPNHDQPAPRFRVGPAGSAVGARWQDRADRARTATLTEPAAAASRRPCWPASTPSSGRRPRRSGGRSASWPAPAPARPGRSPTASPTRCAPARSPPGHLLAVTFTARAAGELRTRLRALGRARRAGPHLPRRGAAPADLLRAPGARRGDARGASTTRSGWSATRPPGCGCAPTAAELRDLAAEIDWAKSVLATPKDYPARAGRGRARHPARRRRRSPRSTPSTSRPSGAPAQLDFADLLLIMAGAIEEFADVAEEVRSRYRHFVVDEYQDVSPLQQRLLDAWLGRPRRPLRGRRRQPDDLQLRRGDARRTCSTSPRRFPDAVVVRLERDYRSTPQIVELANRLVGDTAGRLAPDRPARRTGRRRPSPSTTTSRPRRPRSPRGAAP